jgi:hypothetical protein
VHILLKSPFHCSAGWVATQNQCSVAHIHGTIATPPTMFPYSFALVASHADMLLPLQMLVATTLSILSSCAVHAR